MTKLKIETTLVAADLIFFFSYLEVPRGKINQIRTFPRNFLLCLFIAMSWLSSFPAERSLFHVTERK